ncbi:hypothetical protein [uncultured Microscilla sp.]|uniref:hypothetical protein n=1 Tax=uncultured Microscilla sp. TaxID=432653 RepID=UPI002617E36F|nr:hypothetical protein [uncultured Microscilla sp.]
MTKIVNKPGKTRKGKRIVFEAPRELRLRINREIERIESTGRSTSLKEVCINVLSAGLPPLDNPLNK